MITLRRIKRFVGAAAGAAVLLLSLALAGLLGLALVLIPIGFGILAMEFDRAKRWGRNAKKGSARAQS
jgi:hypothetical protein